MGKTDWGPSLVMAFEPGQLQREQLVRMFDHLLDKDHMLPGDYRARKGNMEFINYQAEGILNRDNMAMMSYLWDDPGPGGAITNQNMTNVYFNPLNDDGFVCGDLEVVVVRTFAAQLNKTAWDKISFILSRMKDIVNILQPKYAAIDNYTENIKKRKGQDLRQFGWGGIVFGPEMVKEVGRERILDCPQLLVKEELGWGGIWAQAWENPFITDWRLRQDMAKWLGLKDLYGEKVEAK